MLSHGRFESTHRVCVGIVVHHCRTLGQLRREPRSVGVARRHEAKRELCELGVEIIAGIWDDARGEDFVGAAGVPCLQRRERDRALHDAVHVARMF